MTIDMHTGTNRLAALVRAVPDDALNHPTPCRDYTVGDLLDHISGFAVGIAAAGRKDARGMTPPGPGRAANLGEGWRTRIPAELAELAVVDRFFSQIGPDQREWAYSPPVDSSVTDRLSRAVAESGRDPDWTP